MWNIECVESEFCPEDEKLVAMVAKVSTITEKEREEVIKLYNQID